MSFVGVRVCVKENFYTLQDMIALFSYVMIKQNFVTMFPTLLVIRYSTINIQNDRYSTLNVEICFCMVISLQLIKEV